MFRDLNEREVDALFPVSDCIDDNPDDPHFRDMAEVEADTVAEKGEPFIAKSGPNLK